MLAGFTPLLFVLFFSFKQQVIRHRMHRRLEEQQLHTVVLAENTVRWAEEGKEILIEGRLFDVQSMEHKDGTIIFHGLYDEEETELELMFNTAWKKNLAGQHRLLAKIFQCLSSFYCNCLPNFNDVLSRSAYTFSFPTPPLPAWVRPILTPPPQA